MFCQCGPPIKQLALSGYDLLRSVGHLRVAFWIQRPPLKVAKACWASPWITAR